VTRLGVAGVQPQPVRAPSCWKPLACASRGERASEQGPRSRSLWTTTSSLPDNPIFEDIDAQALAVSGLDRTRLLAEGIDPAEAMTAAAVWALDVVRDDRSVMACQLLQDGRERPALLAASRITPNKFVESVIPDRDLVSVIDSGFQSTRGKTGNITAGPGYRPSAPQRSVYISSARLGSGPTEKEPTSGSNRDLRLTIVVVGRSRNARHSAIFGSFIGVMPPSVRGQRRTSEDK
jgi:hypothetical protein